MIGEQTVARQRTFECADPAVTAEILESMSGLDFAARSARASRDHAERHGNPMRTTHGRSNPRQMLMRNDACRAFEWIDALLVTRPTRTNVDGFRAVLIA